MDENKKILTVLIEPGKPPEKRYIDKGLESSLQKEVGGLIDIVSYRLRTNPDIVVDLVVNDEGKLRDDFLMNRVLYFEGTPYDVVLGNMVVVSCDEKTGETIGLTEEQADAVMEEFREPEWFLTVNGAIIFFRGDNYKEYEKVAGYDCSAMRDESDLFEHFCL